MFELENYLEYAKLLNEEIVKKHNIQVELHSSNCIILYNKNCKIEFITGRYYVDFLFFLTIKQGNIEKKYSASEVFEQEKIITVKGILTDNQMQEANSMNDKIKKYIYIYSIVIKEKLTKYLMDNFVNGLH